VQKIHEIETRRISKEIESEKTEKVKRSKFKVVDKNLNDFRRKTVLHLDENIENDFEV
jgi:hypothetical protein